MKQILFENRSPTVKQLECGDSQVLPKDIHPAFANSEKLAILRRITLKENGIINSLTYAETEEATARNKCMNLYQHETVDGRKFHDFIFPAIRVIHSDNKDGVLTQISPFQSALWTSAKFVEIDVVHQCQKEGPVFNIMQIVSWSEQFQLTCILARIRTIKLDALAYLSMMEFLCSSLQDDGVNVDEVFMSNLVGILVDFSLPQMEGLKDFFLSR